MSSATIEKTMPGSHRPLPLVIRIAIENCARSFFFWFWLGLTGVFGPALAGIPAMDGQLTWPFFDAYIGGLMAMHLSVEQVTSYRMRLVPGYRQAQLTALACTTAAVFGVSVAWFGFWLRTPVWAIGGWLAVALAIGCFPHFQTKIATWASSAIFFVVVSLSFVPRFARLQAGVELAATWQVNLFLFLVAALLFARFFDRLWNREEADPTYRFLCSLIEHRQRLRGRRPTRAGSAEPDEQPLMSTPLPTLLVRLQEWRLKRALRRGPDGVAWNARRWGLATVPRPLMLILCGSVLLMSLLAGYGRQSHVLFMPQFLLLGLIVAEVALFNRDSRSTMFGFESLRPVTRANYFRQRGARLLASSIKWLPLFGLVWVVSCVVRPMRTPLGVMVAWGCFELAIFFALAAAVAWLRTCRSALPEAIFGGIGTLAVGVGIVATVGPSFLLETGYFAPLLLAAFVIAAAAAVLSWSTYRRWLVMDLE